MTNAGVKQIARILKRVGSADSEMTYNQMRSFRKAMQHLGYMADADIARVRELAVSADAEI